MAKVLQLISSSGYFGAENVLIELSKKLKATSFLPEIGVFDNFGKSHLEIVVEARRYGLPISVFPCRGKVDLRAVRILSTYIRTNGIDIVHSHGYKSNLYALAASRGKKVSKITTCHNWLGSDAKMRFYAWLDKQYLNKFDKIIAVSEPVRAEVAKRRNCRDKVLIINNGICLEKYRNRDASQGVRESLGIDEDTKVVGIVGRLSVEKGHLLFIEAAERVFNQYKGVKFLVIGDGPLRRQLETKTSSEIPVIYTGIRNDMPEIYSVMDIFVLPSYREGLPMALLEAMASEKPTIATRVGSIPEVIEEGRNGLLMDVGDVEGLTQSILEFLRNPEKAIEMGKMGREKVEKEYSSGQMANKYLEVYREVLRNRERKGE